ncbi:hypothetical protein [Rhodopirellula bahusiensis]|uniref:hypothetical protein n=1 Tax=Rhodopirellula bahusiensis TaxID=2014065 RepID=UPI00326700C4
MPGWLQFARFIRWPVFWAAVQSLAAVISIVVAVSTSRQLDRNQVDRLENFVNHQAAEVQRLRTIVEHMQGTQYRHRPDLTPGRWNLSTDE